MIEYPAPESHCDHDSQADAPGWLALRTPPPPVKDDPQLTEPVGQNILGRELFAHTSAVYVEVAGRRHLDPKVAQQLLAEMQAHGEAIAAAVRCAKDA